MQHSLLALCRQRCYPAASAAILSRAIPVGALLHTAGTHFVKSAPPFRILPREYCRDKARGKTARFIHNFLIFVRRLFVKAVLSLLIDPNGANTLADVTVKEIERFLWSIQLIVHRSPPELNVFYRQHLSECVRYHVRQPRRTCTNYIVASDS